MNAFNLGDFHFCSDEEKEDDDDDDDGEENDENMETAETSESRPRNPDDEYNFADYDDEGMLLNVMIWNMSSNKIVLNIRWHSSGCCE